jgi:hypothetical protein
MQHSSCHPKRIAKKPGRPVGTSFVSSLDATHLARPRQSSALPLKSSRLYFFNPHHFDVWPKRETVVAPIDGWKRKDGRDARPTVAAATKKLRRWRNVACNAREPGVASSSAPEVADPSIVHRPPGCFSTCCRISSTQLVFSLDKIFSTRSAKSAPALAALA